MAWVNGEEVVEPIKTIKEKVAEARAKSLNARPKRKPYRRQIEIQNPELAETWERIVVEAKTKQTIYSEEFKKVMSDAQKAGMSYELISRWLEITAAAVHEAVKTYRLANPDN